MVESNKEFSKTPSASAFPGLFETEKARNTDRYRESVILTKIVVGKLLTHEDRQFILEKGLRPAYSFPGLFEVEKERRTNRYLTAVEKSKQLQEGFKQTEPEKPELNFASRVREGARKLLRGS